MRRADVIEVLCRAKWILLDMGDVGAAHQAEQAELRVEGGFTTVQARAYADLVFQRGRRWRVFVVLNRPNPAHVRAMAFIAAVLRSLELETENDHG